MIGVSDQINEIHNLVEKVAHRGQGSDHWRKWNR